MDRDEHANGIMGSRMCMIARGFRGITIVFYSPSCKVLHHLPPA